MPTHTAAMLSRARSSTFIAVLKPCPSTPPISALAGTRTSCRITSEVCEPRWPILRSGGAVVRPGVSRSTMNALTPAAPFFEASVRAISVKIDASGALVM